MAWAKFHDGFDDDPDIDRLSEGAVALFVCSVTWSSRSLTDGFIPESRARKLTGGTPKAIKMLCGGDKPWWLKVEGGYQIRSYHKYNPTAEKVRQDREETFAAKSEAGKKGAIARWQTDGRTHGTADGRSDGRTPVLPSKNDGKKKAPYPVSRFPYPLPQDPKNRNSLEFQREPIAGEDYVLKCSGDEASAKMFKPGTNEAFDPAQWFAERNLEPTRRWESQV